MLARALAVVGDIASIAAFTSLAPAFRRQIIAWLCPLEHIVRKLLLADGAALHLAHRAEAARAPRVTKIALAAPRRTADLQARIKAQTAALDPRRPETWSARFSLAPPRDPLAVGKANAPHIRSLFGASEPAPAPERARREREAETPMRLARRLEALRRVLADPRPHAERLARLLARAVRRFPEIARRYLFMPARTGDYDAHDPRLSIDALAQAFSAPAAFAESG